MPFPKIFYGWWVLLGTFCITAATSIGVSTLPLFYPLLKEEFQWTHEQVTSPASMMYLLAAFSAPLVGFLLDRYRPKVLIIFGALGTFLGLLLYSQIQSLWQLQAVYLWIAFCLATSSIIPGMFLITRWFRRYRGVAAGLFLVGSSFGGIIFPQITKVFLAHYEWREAAVYLAISASILLILPLFIIRESPEKMGLSPDGIPEENKPSEDKSSLSVENPPFFSSVLLQIPFYLIFLATALLYFGLTGVFQNLSLYLEDLNLSKNQTANIFSLYFIFSIVGKLSFGALSDYFDKRNIFLLAIASMSGGLLLLQLAAWQSLAFIIPFAVCYGIGYSGVYAMVQLIVAQYYEGKTYGRVLGFITMADMLAGSLGIFAISTLRSRFGDYDLAFSLSLGFCLLAFALVLVLKRYRSA